MCVCVCAEIEGGLCCDRPALCVCAARPPLLSLRKKKDFAFRSVVQLTKAQKTSRDSFSSSSPKRSKTNEQNRHHHHHNATAAAVAAASAATVSDARADAAEPLALGALKGATLISPAR